MTRIIDGVTYNTHTSMLIAQVDNVWQNRDGIEYAYRNRVYQTRDGAFFVHSHLEHGYWDEEMHKWRIKFSDTFKPMTHDDSVKWLHETGNVKIFSDVLGEPPEAAAELKDRVDRAAQEQKLSANA